MIAASSEAARMALSPSHFPTRFLSESVSSDHMTHQISVTCYNNKNSYVTVGGIIDLYSYNEIGIRGIDWWPFLLPLN